MTRDKAAREAQKRWGKKALIRVEQGLSSPERRADGDRRFAETQARIEAIDREMADRLAALDWYQALKDERKQVVAQKQRAMFDRFYHRFQVGQDELGFAFLVLGKGDTWEEAFADADTKVKV